MAHITFDKFMENVRKEEEEIGIKKGKQIGIKEGEEIGIKKGEEIQKEKSRKKQIAIVENLLKKFPHLSNIEIAQIAQVDEAFVQEIRVNLKQSQ